MGKKKDAAGSGSTKREGGVKLPKQVAGVKVPKALRKRGEALIAQASGPAGRELLVSGLTMAAAAMASRSKPGRAAADDVEQAVQAGTHDVREVLMAMANAATEAFRTEFAKKG